MLEEIALYLGLVSSVLAIVTAIYYVWRRFRPQKRISWKTATKLAISIADEMVGDGFLPSLVFGIGRGGAIMGSLISGCLGHRPLCVIDRIYEWEEGSRTEDILFKVRFPQRLLDKVLVVSGEVHTGNTMRMYCEFFKDRGAKEIRRATLFLNKGSIEQVEYGGLTLHRNILMPWMVSDRYIRQDRRDSQP